MSKRIIYNHFIDDPFECEGMFEVKGDGKIITLLGAWSGNDACWRSEYFNGFMSSLGIEIKQAYGNLSKIVQDHMGKMLVRRLGG